MINPVTTTITWNMKSTKRWSADVNASLVTVASIAFDTFTTHKMHSFVMKHDIHLHPFSMFHPLSFLVSIPPPHKPPPLPSPIKAPSSLSANQTSPQPPPPSSQRSPNRETPPLLAPHGLMKSPKLPPTQRPRPCPPRDRPTDPTCSPSNPCLCTTHPPAHPPPLHSCHPSLVSSSPRLLSLSQWLRASTQTLPTLCRRLPPRALRCPHPWAPLSTTLTTPPLPRPPLPRPHPPRGQREGEGWALCRWPRPPVPGGEAAWRPAAPPTGGPASILSRTTSWARRVSIAARCRVSL